MIFFIFSFFAIASWGQVESFIQKAHELELAQDVGWIRLLRYEGRFLGGYKGDVASEGFYLAADGRTNPKSELDATLRGLFSGEIHAFAQLYGNELDHMAVRCQFPARTQFLIERLQINSQALAPADCSRFEKFRDSFQSKSVFLVFSSYYLNNPSSAFGHTFLRFSKVPPGGQEAEKTELLDVGVNNAAELTTSNAIVYAIGGLAGLFRGVYTSLPYYYKVREYNDYEARDLYSYELNLTQSEIDRLIAHIWEVGGQYSKYYYLRQNCAYQILAAIEAAAPRYNLLEKLKLYVIPSDTARLAYETPGLVRRVTYRPSIRSVFLKRIENLSSAEVDAVESWGIDRKKPLNWDSFELSTKVRILDAAMDYVDFKYAKEIIVEKSEPAQYRENLLRERASLGVRSEPLQVVEDPRRKPHTGHRSSRLGLSYGREKGVGGFVQGDVRFALNELLDPPQGYPEHSQIGMFDWAFRWLTDAQRFEVEHLRLADVNSLSPRERFVKNQSFKMDVKATRFRDSNCDRCFGGQIEGGAGLTWDVGFSDLPVLVFAHAEGEADYAPGFSGSNFRLGAGPGTGLLIGGERVRLLVTWSPRWLIFARESFYYKERLEARFSPSENFSLGAGVESVLTQWQGSLKGYFYF